MWDNMKTLLIDAVAIFFAFSLAAGVRAAGVCVEFVGTVMTLTAKLLALVVVAILAVGILWKKPLSCGKERGFCGKPVDSGCNYRPVLPNPPAPRSDSDSESAG